MQLQRKKFKVIRLGERGAMQLVLLYPSTNLADSHSKSDDNVSKMNMCTVQLKNRIVVVKLQSIIL
jgi:hypothetical protein